MQARAQRDPAFRDALLTESVEALLAGEVETGKVILRDYINATLGFGRLAEATGTESKSLTRMPGSSPRPAGDAVMRFVASVFPQMAICTWPELPAGH